MLAVAENLVPRILEMLQRGIEIALEQTVVRSQLAAQRLFNEATVAIDSVLPGTSPETAGVPALALLYILAGGAVVIWKLRSLR
jgi:hypothetical protein